MVQKLFPAWSLQVVICVMKWQAVFTASDQEGSQMAVQLTLTDITCVEVELVMLFWGNE